MNEIKVGKLTSVSKYAGIKIDNGDWINAHKDIKLQIDVGALKKKVGSEVKVTMEDDHWKALEVIEQKTIEKIEEENIDFRDDNKVPASVWEQKDRRMVRMNVLRTAMEFFKEYDKEITAKKEFIFELAEEMENWIYR